MCSDFGKKGPDCVHLWVKFSIQNVVLRVPRRKISKKCFLVGPLFLVFFMKCLSKCPSFTNLPPPVLKSFWLHICPQALFFFEKHSILNVWQCSEYLCLDNCSVICTVMLCTASDTFRIQAYSALFFPGMCRYIQSYSVLLKSDSHLPKKLFASMIAPQKWWKLLFIWSKSSFRSQDF